MAKGLGTLIILLIVEICAIVYLTGIDPITIWQELDLTFLMGIIAVGTGAAIILNALDYRPFRGKSA
jgi:hypothetical protein